MNRVKERYNFRRPEIIAGTKKQKEKIQINLKPLKNVLYLLAVAAFIYVVIFSSLFRINNVTVEGVRSIEISDYLKKNLMGKNILMLRTGQFLHQAENEFPVLSELMIVRGIPNTIKLTVLERDQIMILCNNLACYEIDNKGYAYKKIIKPADKVILVDEKDLAISEGDRVVSEAFIYFFLGALAELKKLGLNITSAKMSETTFKVTFVTNEGWSIVTDSSYSLKNQVSAVKQLLEKNRSDIHEYVDVRVEGVAYIK